MEIPFQKRAFVEKEALRYTKSQNTIEIFHGGERIGDRCNHNFYLLHALSKEEDKSLDTAPEDQLESWRFWQQLRLVLESNKGEGTCSCSEDVSRAGIASIETTAASWISECIVSHKDYSHAYDALNYSRNTLIWWS